MRIIRGLATAAGVIALTGALVCFTARYLPIVNHPVLVLALAAPLALFAAPLAVAVFALARRWILAAVAAVVTVVVVGTQLPSLVGAAPPASATSVGVVSLNMKLGQADPASVVKLASSDADVLAVQELTPDAAAALSEAGLDAVFPHRLIDPRPSAYGIGVWSRFPLTDTGSIDGLGLPALTARIEIPGVTVDPVLAVVHLIPPWPPPVIDWRDDLARLSATLAHLADVAGDGAVLVSGDFNSTTDLKQFRDALTEGYRNAAEQAGVAVAPTYPAHRLTPVIAIDHVLTRNATATALETVGVPGTDHRALLATIMVPRG